jgi:hypothetical protein
VFAVLLNFLPAITLLEFEPAKHWHRPFPIRFVTTDDLPGDRNCAWLTSRETRSRSMIFVRHEGLVLGAILGAASAATVSN